MWTHDFLPAKLSLLICRQGLQGILSEPVLGLMAAGSLGSHPHAVDVPGWVTPWGGGRPVYCGMFTSISGLCPLALPPLLDAAVVTSEDASRHCQLFPGRLSPLVA